MKKQKARNNIIKKTKKITSSVWTTTKNKKSFFKKTHKNLANKSVEKKTVFSDSRCRQLNYYSIDDALLFVCAL
jgi:hypothetical protein